MPRERLPYRSLRSSLPLAAMGLAIETLYLLAVLGPFSLVTHGTKLVDLGYLTHYEADAGRAITVGLLALFLFYGLALIFASEMFRMTGATVALLGTAVFSLTLSFLYPVTANDVYTYAVQGYVATYHGLNPLVDPPARVANDSFVTYAGQWAHSASPYGPLWVDVSRLAAWISGRNIVGVVAFLKLVNASAVIGSTALLTRLVPQRRALAAVFFGWNPLVQIELVGNGHNDALMILLLLAAITLARVRRPAFGAVLLTGSILTKYLTIGVLPFFLTANLADRPRALRLRRKHRIAVPGPSRLARVVPGILAAFVTATALFAPYWVGPATIERVLAVDQNYLASPAALTILLVPGSVHWLALARFAILAGVYGWLIVRQLRGTIGVQNATFEGLFALVVCAPHFAGWYLAVLVALAPLAGGRWTAARAAIFTLSATLTVPLWAFVWPTQHATIGLTTFHEIIVPLTFGPPLVVAALGAIATRRSPGRAAAKVEDEAVERVLESA